MTTEKYPSSSIGSSRRSSCAMITKDKVNKKHLERLLSYQTGYLRYDPGADNPLSSFGGGTPFRDAGAFLPYLVDHEHYTCVQPPEKAAEQQQNATATSTVVDVDELLKTNGKLIEVTNIDYKSDHKPIAIIYNPTSGSGKMDIREQIRTTLQEKNSIELEFFETKYPMHAWDLVENEIDDLSKYSVIASVGGDGTFHEVVNGLMNRTRNRNHTDTTTTFPPLAFLPNGTGNDLLANFGVTTLEQGLEALVKGETVKMDCNLVLLDAENVSQVPEDERRDRVRYSIANAAVGFVAHVNKKASSLKSYVGKLAYSITGLKELLLNIDPIPKYDLVLEQPTTTRDESSNNSNNFQIISDLQTLFLFVNNGKYAGGHSNFTPGALLNDGLLDVIYKEGSFNIFVALKCLDQASRQQGNHVFREDLSSFRAKSILITVNNNKEKEEAQYDNNEQVQLFQVDGEDLEFRNYVKMEAVPAALNVVADCQRIMSLGPMIHV